MEDLTPPNFEIRRQRALVLLEKSGIHKFNYCPPVTTLLWRLRDRAFLTQFLDQYNDPGARISQDFLIGVAA
jgi:hypothetical protein